MTFTETAKRVLAAGREAGSEMTVNGDENCFSVTFKRPNAGWADGEVVAIFIKGRKGIRLHQGDTYGLTGGASKLDSKATAAWIRVLTRA